MRSPTAQAAHKTHSRTWCCRVPVQCHPLHGLCGIDCSASSGSVRVFACSCNSTLINTPQMRPSGDRRVTEREQAPFATRPSQNRTKTLSESLRRSTGRNALFFTDGLTMIPNAPTFHPSARTTPRRSASQKGASGLAARQVTRRPKPRRSCVVFPFPAPLGPGLWVRADGSASARRFLVSGTANPVRPARQISSLACRVFKPYEETCHV